MGHGARREDEQDGDAKVFRYVRVRRAAGVRLAARFAARSDGFMFLRAVGEDPLGNRYFENRNETYGRDRWVECVLLLCHCVLRGVSLCRTDASCVCVIVIA